MMSRTRWQGSAAVIFCRRHIGIPLERAPGEWIHSVTTPHELLPLLGRILRIAVTTTEHGPALARRKRRSPAMTI
jgi:two-component system capsular synthesis sensor histidine kinase RcsC